jgi:hypothetical protein
VAAHVANRVSLIARERPALRVVFFRDGKQIASHSIAALVRTAPVIRSDSHVWWLARGDGGHGHDVEWHRSGLTLYTTSFRRVSFDTSTGRITETNDTDLWRMTGLSESVSDSDGLPNRLRLLEHVKHEMGDVGA